MTHLSDVVNIDLLDEMVQNKYVKIQTHPEFPEYSIANYTDSCMWDQVWNEATLNCRGLIFNSKTLQVMERPFSKFFNYEQEQAPKWDLSTKIHVTDKMDGSLGILYWRPDSKPAIATRGSFDSDQARWATDFYQRVYWNNWYPNANFTYLFEIIYPENRIVINYGDMTDLVLLGAVDIATGQSIPPDVAASESEWVGSHAPIYWQDTTLENVISQPPRAGMEGFVLWNRDTDERVKIKYDEYKMLHRYLTNTTPKHVWEVLSTEQDPNEIFASAPDEFHVWLKEVLQDLEDKFSEIFRECLSEFSDINNDLPKDHVRKDFALAVKDSKYKSLLFKLYDDQSVDETIWRMIKPSGSRTVRTVSSDAD